MGSACAKLGGRASGRGLDLKGKPLTAAEARKVLVSALGAAIDLNLFDNTFTTLTRSEVEAFLRGDELDSENYHAETYDCDDFAMSEVGRSRLWLARNSPHARENHTGSLAFGILTGDIRDDGNDANNDVARHHAVNVAIVRVII
jgi:hypothetical protein